MTTSFVQQLSTNQYLPFGYKLSQRNDHIGVQNTNTLEHLMDGKLSREYYFQTRSFGNMYISVVTKLHISDQTWNTFIGTFSQDEDVEAFVNNMLTKQDDKDLVGLIGNNLTRYPEVVGLVIMGDRIYHG